MKLNYVVKHKYDVGDSVYAIYYNYTYKKCDICEFGKVEINDETFNCPKCGGTGKNPDGKKWDCHSREYVVKEIRIFKDGTNEDISYTLIDGCNIIDFDYAGTDFSEEYLFESEDEAMEECERKNALGIC